MIAIATSSVFASCTTTPNGGVRRNDVFARKSRSAIPIAFLARSDAWTRLLNPCGATCGNGIVTTDACLLQAMVEDLEIVGSTDVIATDRTGAQGISTAIAGAGTLIDQTAIVDREASEGPTVIVDRGVIGDQE